MKTQLPALKKAASKALTVRAAPSLKKTLTVGDLLVRVGIYPDINGFGYIVDAVDIINNLPPQYNYCINTTDVYQQVAQRCHERGNTKIAGHQVERGIRHAVEIAYNTCDLADPESVLNIITGNSTPIEKTRLTAGQFVFTLAYFCRKHSIIEPSYLSTTTFTMSEALKEREEITT